MAIYRFKLEDSFVNEITIFAKIHQYDTNKDYKKAWDIWCEENNDSVRREIIRLDELGYDGNSLDKIYKAGRYYFRKKQLNAVSNPKQRKTYLSMDAIVLEAMDEHIVANSKKPDFTPSRGYEWFCTEYYSVLQTEITRIILNNDTITTANMILKVKKTYKNRYFIFTQSQLSDITRNYASS